MTIPQWIPNAIFYQIFPDRFANGSILNDPPNVKPWGTRPDTVHFQGGDLIGISQQLDYLVDLAINAIYLNPIFLSPSTHRYNTVDYFLIDPKLGNQDEFGKLIFAAHERGIKVILDGVFNHSGRGFFAFNDILENGAESAYRDWYHIQNFPLDAYTPGEAKRYRGWWGYKSLPKFNTDYPAVKKYIFEAAKYWIDQGIDGWRLDVPNEIDDDQFWSDFRDTVKNANPEAYILGEIWDIQPRWVGEQHFDGLMNYPIRSAILDMLVGKIQSSKAIEIIKKILISYPGENQFAMFNLLGSHDTERVKTNLGNCLPLVKLAYLILFALQGCPCIYYGDEIGMIGGKDPDCRGAFPWEGEKWDKDLRDWVRKCAHTRKAHSILCEGVMNASHLSLDPDVFMIHRSQDNQRFCLIVNPTHQKKLIQIPVSELSTYGSTQIRELLGQTVNISIVDEIASILLDPISGIWLLG